MRSSWLLAVVGIVILAFGLALFMLREPSVPAGVVRIADAPAPTPELESATTLAATDHLQPALEQRVVASSASEQPAAAADPVRGVVVDALTGLPLGHFLFLVESKLGPTEEVLSDEQGRFALERIPATAHMDVYPLDRPGSTRRSERIAVAAPGKGELLWIPVVVGPTIRLELEPQGLLENHGFTASIDLGQTRPVHGTRDAWIRLEPVHVPRTDEITITVRSDNGVWIGTSAPVELGAAIEAPVRVRLAGLSVLKGRVRDAAGEPIADATLRFETHSGERAPDGDAYSDTEGRFLLGFLPAAPGTLRVRSLRHEPQDLAFDLVPRVIRGIEVELVPTSSLGAISGTVTCATDVRARLAAIALFRMEPGDMRVRLRAPLEWRARGDGFAADFAFSALPAREYALDLGPTLGFDVQGLRYVLPGDAPVELTVIDLETGDRRR